MFKFSIRELLLLAVIVGLGLGWLLENRRNAWAMNKADSLDRGMYSVLGWIEHFEHRRCVYVDAFDGKVYGDLDSADYILETDMSPDLWNPQEGREDSPP